jgi:transposase
MIRLTDGQWERIWDHFPEEHIADGRPGRKPISTRHVLEAVDIQHRRAMAHAAAKLAR